MACSSDSPPFALPPDATIYVAGHAGLAGSAISRLLTSRGFHVLGRMRSELDLRDRDAVEAFFRRENPTHVILAAARVGGILANSTFPADFLSDNLRIQLNVLDAAAKGNVERLIFLGSSCIYPKYSPQPIDESSLLTGALETTNDAYAIAKIAGVLQVQALRRQFGLSFISTMPTNLYGPGDNFSRGSSHVLPAMMRRLHEAKLAGDPEVVMWGSGTPRRDFLHVDDLASAVIFLLENYDDGLPINIGTGSDISISELARRLATIIGYSGRIAWDESKPDGTPRKLLSIARLRNLGWSAATPLAKGLPETYKWFLGHHDLDARL